MDIEQYLLVNWEQLSEEAPPVACEDVGVNRSGYLLLKTTNLIGIPTWRPAYFTIRWLPIHMGRIFVYFLLFVFIREGSSLNRGVG